MKTAEEKLEEIRKLVDSLGEEVRELDKHVNTCREREGEASVKAALYNIKATTTHNILYTIAAILNS